jgi:hypothetical protein
MTTTVDKRPSALELYLTGSGKALPTSPSDEDIATTIRQSLALAVGNDTFGNPTAQAALIVAAQAVRDLFLTVSVFTKDQA